jgi:O-antigen ligase
VVLSYWIPRLNRHDIKGWGFLAILVMLATFSIIQTQVRAAYIAYAILSLLFILFYTKGWLKLVSLITISAAFLLMSVYSVSVNSRMSLAYTSLKNYLALENHADPKNTAVNTSVGTRLEMWRAAPLVLREHPLVGVGNGNYNVTVKEFAKQGLIHPAVTHHSHPHNVFVGATIDKGLIGLVSVLLVFFFPLYVYIKTYPAARASAITGILYVVTIFAYSMNETATFEKSNFLATNLVFGLVIFRNHVKNLKQVSAG